MNIEKVVFAFFIVLAATLNLGFVYGDIDEPAHHEVYELFAAVVVNLIVTVLKFGDRTHIGAVHLATSLVAVLQLVAASLVWAYAISAGAQGLQPGTIAGIVSLSVGALLANAVSITLLVSETIQLRR
ncbi:MAG: hypothetical protein A3I01_07890 [Betaproteobacteria bacterium RIFCSPLOWO2_02_FULL_65_24]|nr:MAG: hypothetical protein A3I01_07890 [Betaproteobacteria bacterium RIFCSPLOWO2_02_FULL_65_24]OGA32922.1 MAG: hypothetical protein A3G80_15810 [Betaproteobacteria bacterium RIFCSPLOWO2_12_FULL_62_13b]